MTRRSVPAPAQEGLLDLLSDVPVQPAPEVWGAAEGYVKWLKPPAGRNLCADCVALIHGRRDGPSPRTATTRRKGPNGERLLCAQHAQIQRELDDKAEAARKERLKGGRQEASRPAKAKKYREHS